MSDPVANVDIEDVLSSIRRLVSNGPDRGDAASDGARGGDRLVLTPSQRVDEAGTEKDGQTGETGGASGQAVSGAAGVTDAQPPEMTQPLHPGSGTDAAQEPTGGEGAGPAAEPEPEPEPEPEVDLAAFSDDLSAAREDAPCDAAPDVWDGEAAEEAGPAADTGETPDDPELAGIAAMFARHESGTSDTWEPDGDDEDAFAEGVDAPTLDWRDVEPDSAADEAEREVAGGGDIGADDLQDRAAEQDRARAGPAREDGDNAFAIEDEAMLDEAVLDEAALRDLVAEIVREELMGTLGERITRNVRKLVRREIHRALNSQDFD